MNRHLAAVREEMLPSWDRARERRVLERVYAGRASRSRAFRFVAWSSVVATAVVLFRLIPAAARDSGAPSLPHVQPASGEPSTSNPPPDFSDGGDREG